MKICDNSAPVQLLAPAGNWEGLRAAVEHGADAVYFGVSGFNARARADNFTVEQLPEVMQYLHLRGVQGFLALNVLVFESEVRPALEILAKAYAASVDAVLLQDLGMAQLAHRYVPDLVLHASTQMTVTDPLAIEYLRGIGVERFVLPREFSVEDIRAVSAQTDAELECFVHGALCVAWSGQCLTSESFGGRSANRGQCAQACRQPYQLYVDGAHHDLGDQKYLLSPQDLVGYESIPELIDAGISCLKIEGRLKSREYIANITRHYRSALDQAQAGTKLALSRQARQDIAQSFSRGLTTGFLDGVNHQTLVPGMFPKSRGLYAGIVEEIKGTRIVIKDSGLAMQRGDGIVFDNGDPERKEPGGRIYDIDYSDQRLMIDMGRSFNLRTVRPGDKVWRTSDSALQKKLGKSLKRDERCAYVDIHVQADLDQPVRAHFRCGRYEAEVQSDSRAELARNRPLDEEILRTKLGQMGQTHFALGSLSTDLQGAVSIPVKELKTMRRDGLAQLEQCIIDDTHRTVPQIQASLPLEQQPRREGQAVEQASLRVFCRSEAQIRAACDAGVDRIYADFEDPRWFGQAVEVARASSTEIYLATPRIVKPGEHGYFRKLLRHQPDGILVRNLHGILYFGAHSDLPMVADFSLNCANRYTADFLETMGCVELTPSYDLNAGQMKDLLESGACYELVLHQHMPMFHMEHCVYAALLSDGRDYRSCGRPCESHMIHLQDHTGLQLPVMADVGCRNTVFNGKAQTGVRHLREFQDAGARRFRLELLDQDADQTIALIESYQGLLRGDRNLDDIWQSLKAQNQLGVTSGTLTH